MHASGNEWNFFSLLLSSSSSFVRSGHVVTSLSFIRRRLGARCLCVTAALLLRCCLLSPLPALRFSRSNIFSLFLLFSSLFSFFFFFLLLSSSSFNTLCHLVTTSKKRNIQHETNHTKHMTNTTCSHTKRIFSFDVFEIRVALRVTSCIERARVGSQRSEYN